MNWIILTGGIPQQTLQWMGEISVRLLGGFRRAGGFYCWNKESPTRVLLYEYFYPSTPLLHIF